MAEDTNRTHKTLNYFNSGLLAILTGFVGWQQVELSNYRTNSEEERRQLLDYTLEAKKEAKAAKETAESTKETVESTRKTVEMTKKAVDRIE